MRVLIVEDDPLIALELADQLKEDGHEVIGTATSAGQAQRLIATALPDLMLVDIHLEDGETGCDFAHATKRELNVPTIFVTGSPWKARECDNALGVLAKPFTPAGVTAAVEAAAIIRAGGKPMNPPTELELFLSNDAIS